MILHTTGFEPRDLKTFGPFSAASSRVFTAVDCDDKNILESCQCINRESVKATDSEEINKKSQIFSDIKNSKQPYKEIEVKINNSELALRIQRYQLIDKEKWDAPCTQCFDNLSKKSSKIFINNLADINHDNNEDDNFGDGKKLFFEAIEPNLELKNDVIQLRGKNLATNINQFQVDENINENKDFFLLKIRRRAEGSDKKREHMDLEFRLPHI